MAEFVTVREFLELTRLSEATFVSMLENGEIPFSRGEDGALLVDIAEIAVERIGFGKWTIPDSSKPQERQLLEEMVAAEIMGQLEEIVEEAFDLVMDWQSREH